MPGGTRAGMTKTTRTGRGSTSKYAARPEQTPPTMRSDPRRKTPPVVSPTAPQLSHGGSGARKRGRGGRALVGWWAALDRSAAHQQVVNDPDNRQQQQQMNEPTADAEGEAEEPQDEEHDDDGPDQASHKYLPKRIPGYM